MSRFDDLIKGLKLLKKKDPRHPLVATNNIIYTLHWAAANFSDRQKSKMGKYGWYVCPKTHCWAFAL